MPPACGFKDQRAGGIVILQRQERGLRHRRPAAAF